MDLYRFLFFDIAILIAIISLLFLLKVGKKKFTLFRITNKEKLFRKTSLNLPDKEKLFELEKVAKNQGSGIEFNSITGDWTFVSVWKKDIDEEDPVFTSLLKVFAAKIEFKRDILVRNSPKLSLIVSIQFGLFTIEFSGFGCLKGQQPLLPFFFNLIQLKSGTKTLLSRSLKEPREIDKSFFTLIALEKSSSSLIARVKGGAVMILLKN